MDIGTFDLLAVGLYFIVVLAIGFWSGRGERDAEDYFLAARALPWYLIGFSLFASNMSGASFVGLMGASYEYGLVVFHYEWTAALVLAVFAAFMLPVFLRARIFTLPEYLEVRFDRRSRLAYAAFTLLTLLFIDMAGAIYAGGVVASTVFPEVGLWETGALIAVLAGGYTLFGGLRAVVATDALQAVFILLGCALIFAIGLVEVGGWHELRTRLDAGHLELFKSAGDDFLPWPGLAGVVLLGFYYWSLNQYFAQRALAARSLDEGRKGALFGGLLKLPNLALMIVPGMIAVVLYPDLGNPDRVFPMLAFDLLPTGLRGLMLAALLAAIMSSLDSAMNAAASLLTMDFVRSWRPDTSGRALLVIGRGFTLLLIAIAALYAPVIREFGSLFQYFQSTLAYIVPPVVAVYALGLFSRRITARAAFAALVGGIVVGLFLYAANEASGLWTTAGLPELHFTVAAALLFALSLTIATAVTLLAPRATTPTDATFRPGDLSPTHGGLKDYRIPAILLVLLLAGLLAALSCL